MKALPKKLLPLTLFGIAVTSLFPVQPVQGFTITMEQIGSNVVANGSGAIELTGLSFLFGGIAIPNISPNTASLSVGQSASVDAYSAISGPASFGSGGFTFANGGSGDAVGVQGLLVLVPQGYVSGTALSDSMTFNNSTFASLGVTPGTYEWTWGTGLRNQNFTLIIGGAGVPDGGSTVSLLSCALLGLAALRRKLGG
jgi:protein with PEP-CTERM/exosortase system signal